MIFKSFISYLLGFMGGSIFMIFIVLKEKVWIGAIINILFFILSQLISVGIKNKMKENYWKKIKDNKWS